jgi:ABC-type nitrate/sulfonate/bicarbonate transport system substrate-binding protein
VRVKTLRCCRSRMMVIGLGLTVMLTFSPVVAIGQPSLQRVRVASPTKGIPFFPMYVARDFGFFRGEDLFVEEIVMGLDVAIAGVVAGELGYVTGTGSATRAAVAGVPVKAVMFAFDKVLFTLHVLPSIKSIADLRGKRVAVNRPVTTDAVFARAALERGGVDPATVTFSSMVATSTRLAALKSHAVEAAVLTPPFDAVGIKEGYRVVARAADVLDMPWTGLATSTRRLTEKPGEVKAMIRAMLKTLQFIRQNRDASIGLIRKEFQLDESLASDVYDQMVPALSTDGTASIAAIENDIALARRSLKITKPVEITQVVDFSLLNEIRPAPVLKP